MSVPFVRLEAVLSMNDATTDATVGSRLTKRWETEVGADSDDGAMVTGAEVLGGGEGSLP